MNTLLVSSNRIPIRMSVDKPKNNIVKKFQSRKFAITGSIIAISTALLISHNVTQDAWVDINRFCIGSYFASNVSSVFVSKKETEDP